MTHFLSLTVLKKALEVAESVDLNRILENGGKIRMVEASRFSFGVDTPEELELANKLMSKISMLLFMSSINF